MPSPNKRHPNNWPGDFYVVCDECMSCEAPCDAAPDLMGLPGSSDANYGCFFHKQPTSPEELDHACGAVAVSCVEAVRYAGNDSDILRKLYSLGAYASCDVSGTTATEIEQTVIDHVKRNYRSAARHDVHWTYICEDTEQLAIVACCYGSSSDTLGVFALDKASGSVSIIDDDDRNFRPNFDLFKRPKQSGWHIWPWART